MHIPDGLLSFGTLAVTGAVSAGTVAVAVKQANKKIKEKNVPLMGVMAAFIFAAQMVNFPIPGGTSGHLIGAALAVILLGPWSAIIILTCILFAQCLIFQDGGLVALGANILNMGVLGTLAGWLALRLNTVMFGPGSKAQIAAAFTAAWLSVVISAAACAFELAFSGVAPAGIVIPAMIGVHAVIGIGEGIITVAVVALVKSVRIDLMEMAKI